MPGWERFQLYLFDFDGVLVDTELLHFKAYQRMLARRGFDLKWGYHDYAKIALFEGGGLKRELYAMFPALQQQEGCWDVLYQEKRECYLELLDQEGVALMPGVEELLAQLTARKIPSCVVTHSPLEQIEKIRGQHRALQQIPHWVTRENYNQPKPHPECYQTAIQCYAKPGDRIIGFEDSPRGMRALSQSIAKPVLVTSFLPPEQIEALAQTVDSPFTHFPTFIDYLRYSR